MRIGVGFGSIILAAGLASLLSLPSPYWFFPLLFSSLSLIGFYPGKSYMLDIGIFLSIISYLFVNRGLGMIVPNVLLVIGAFFLFIGVWFYTRNMLTTRRIERTQERNSSEWVSSFRKSALSDISSNLLLGFFLAVIGSLIGMYSSLNLGLTFDIESILMVVFSSAVFFIIYLTLNILSSESTEE